MKYHIPLFLFVVIFSHVVVITTVAQESVPAGMTYQGRITGTDNAPAPDGTGYEIEVRLWDAPTDGTLVWGARYNDVSVKSGTFNLILGADGGESIVGAEVDDLSLAFDSPNRYMGLTVTNNGGAQPIESPSEILPRQQFLSAPFSFRAHLAYDSERLGNQPATFYSPTGSIVAFAGDAAPDGWLICDGRSLATQSYPALAVVIGSSFGTSGTGTFKLPDLRGRFPLGSSSANEPGGAISAHPVAQNGGAETHTLTVEEMPSHGHNQRYNTGQANGATGAYVAGLTYAASAARALRHENYTTQSAAPIASTGGDAAHNNMPPFLALNFIIKY